MGTTPCCASLPRDGVEDALDGRRLRVRRGEAEEGARRGVREGPLRPHVRDLQRLLQREARAHHLAVDGADGLRREAPGARGEAVEDEPLALRIVGREVRVALGPRHVGDDAGALVERLQDGVVELVDALAEVVEGHGGAA